MAADVALRAMIKHLAKYHRQSPEDISEELEVEVDYVLRALGRTEDPRVVIKTPPTEQELVQERANRSALHQSILDAANVKPAQPRPTRDAPTRR